MAKPPRKEGEGAGVDNTPSRPSPFDVQTIRHLVALLSRHDLSEIDLREGALRIRLRRGTQGTVVAHAAPSPATPAAPAVPAPAAPAQPEAPAPAAAPERAYQFIKS